jgi:hypothetical protein
LPAEHAPDANGAERGEQITDRLGIHHRQITMRFDPSRSKRMNVIDSKKLSIMP